MPVRHQESPAGPYTHQLDPKRLKQDPTPASQTLYPSTGPQEPLAGPYICQPDPTPTNRTPRASGRTLHLPARPQESPARPYTHQLDSRSCQPDPSPTSWTPRATGQTPLLSPRPQELPPGPQESAARPHTHQPDPQGLPMAPREPPARPDVLPAGPRSAWVATVPAPSGTHKPPGSDPRRLLVLPAFWLLPESECGPPGGTGTEGGTSCALVPSKGESLSGGAAPVPVLPLDSPWLPEYQR